MFGSNFKKFNSVLILFLVYISLKNITKFTEDDMEMPSQNYQYQFSQDDSPIWNSQEKENQYFDPNEDSSLNPQN